MRECNFEELPVLLQERITRIGKDKSFKVLRCLCSERKYAECIIKDGSIFGLFTFSCESVDVAWVNSSDIKFLYNAIQQSTRP